MLATAAGPISEAEAPHVAARDEDESSRRSYTVVGGPREVRRLTTELRSRQRRYAIVALSLADGSQRSAFPFGGIWTELAQPVPIYLLPSPYICRRFAEAVGSYLGCSDGAARIFWPEATGSDSGTHPLVLPEAQQTSRRTGDRHTTPSLPPRTARLPVGGLLWRNRRVDAHPRRVVSDGGLSNV